MKLIVGIHTQYTQKGEFDYKPIWYLLEEYFPDRYQAIKFSIDGGKKARFYKKGIKKDYKNIFIVPKRPTILRYIMEVVYMFLYLIYAKLRYKNISFLGIDPLSCFSGAILRKLRIIDKCILITPDFAEQRFENKVLNKIYFFCDKLSTTWSDYNYCSSTQTIEKKKEMYGEKVLCKLKHIPGYPPQCLVSEIKLQKKMQNHIVYVGGIYEQINFEEIFDIISNLKKDIPNLTFSIIGDGTYFEKCKKYINDRGYSDYINLLGYKEYDEALSIISSAEIGLAIYNGDLFFDKYRDSCKVRDYLAFGVIPVMTDVVPSTAKDLGKFEAGEVIGLGDVKNLGVTIRKVIQNKNSYIDGIKKLRLSHKEKYLYLMKDLDIGKK